MVHRRTKKASLVALAAAGALILASCSGGGDTTEGTDAEGGPATPTLQPVTLTIQHSLLAEEARTVLTDAIAGFEAEHENVTIETAYVPWADLHTTTLAKFASGEAPDIMYGSDGWGMPEFSDLGMFLDLDKYMDEDLRAKFAADAFEPYGTTALPFSMSFEQIVFYRPELFAAAGVEPPPVDQAWGWDEFLAAATALTQDVNGDGQTDQWGFSERGKAGTLAAKSWIPYLQSYGTDIIVPGNDGWEANLDDPDAVAALERMISLSTEYGVVPPDFIGWDLPEAVEAWNTGQLAMLNIGSWFAGSIEGEYGTDYDVMLFPTDGEPAAYVSNNWWTVAAESEHPDEAFAFLEYLYDPVRLQDLAEANNNAIPATADALQDEHYSSESFPLWADRLSLWQDYIVHAPTQPDYMNLWVNDVVPYLQTAIEGDDTAEGAVSKAQNALEQDLAD